MAGSMLSRRVRSYATATFASLGVRNFRLFFVGQGISLTGTFMEAIALAWLVLTLTGRAAAVGLVSALQFGPVLVLAPYGGTLADRFPKRRVLFVTQSAFAALSLLLWALVVTGAARLWTVYAIAAAVGVVNSLDNPARQTFAYEMVGGEGIANAVALIATEFNLSRVTGPALAAVLIATVGIAQCFLFNALSFLALIAALALVRTDELTSAEPEPTSRGLLREGLVYAWRTPMLRVTLLAMAAIGTLTYEFQVSLSALSRVSFSAGATGFSLLTSAMGVGAVAGGLAVAAFRRPSMRALTGAAIGFGASVAFAALSPTLAVATGAMVVVGACAITFTSLSNTILQLHAEPRMRGRVLALWSAAFLGSTVVGAPVVGWVADALSPRWALGIGALVALAAGAYTLISCEGARPVRR